MQIFKFVWKKWMVVAKVVGNFQAQVIFSAFYLLLFSVLGIIFRFFSDPLRIKTRTFSKRKSNFTPWEYKQNTITEIRKQF